MARCPQRVHSSRWPPSAAVRHRAMASSTLAPPTRIDCGCSTTQAWEEGGHMVNQITRRANDRERGNGPAVSGYFTAPTVKIPETEMGMTNLTKAPKRVRPSTIAASSSSLGMDLKKPMRSQMEKGTVKVG